jgi:DNA-binding ferritin-like protein
MDSKYSDCLLTFMTILNQIKLYHWQTLSYARHKATDELYQELSDLIDKFIETLHGRIAYNANNSNYRIMLADDKSYIYIKNIKDIKGYELLKNIKTYLESDYMKAIVDNYTELQNIRDEMLGIVNKTTYLFTLN